MKMSVFEVKCVGEVASVNMKKLGVKWVIYCGEKIEYAGADKLKYYDIILCVS